MREDVEMQLVDDDPVHGQTFSHPAFGQVVVSRVTGDRTLYGSDFVHRAYVTLSVHRSELHRNLSRDWHHACQEILEINLSQAQWATLVSSFGIGEGVPCTLSRVQGESMPGIPLRIETEVVRQETREVGREMSARIEKAIGIIEDGLKGLSQVKRDRVLGELRALQMELEQNEPFRQESFDRHMEKTVEKAKVEVNAYVEMTVRRAGLDSIEARRLLGTGSDG